MTFKEWCLKKYGIIKITEGKILNLKLISFTKNPFLDDTLKQLLVDSYDARPVYQDGQLIGYSVTKDACEHFAETLKTQHNFEVKSKEYKVPAQLLLKLAPPKTKDFLSRFSDILLTRDMTLYHKSLVIK